jgi:hypothetical protein
MITESGRDVVASDEASLRLADLLLDTLLAQPLDRLLPPPLLATLLRQSLLVALRSPEFEPQVAALLQVVRHFLTRPEHAGKRLRELLPNELLATARKLVSHPYAPEKGLIIAAFAREPFRRLNRELMTSTLASYGRRIRSSLSDAGSSKGLGALGRLASAAVSKGSSAIGTIAGGVAAVVSDEFERQLQRRASEFADAAVDEVVGQIATTLTDPTQAPVQRELKLAMFEYLLELRGQQLGRELERFQPQLVAGQLREGLLAWLDSATAEATLAELLTALFAHNHGRSLRDLAGDEALLAPLLATVRGQLGPILAPLVASGRLTVASQRS